MCVCVITFFLLTVHEPEVVPDGGSLFSPSPHLHRLDCCHEDPNDSLSDPVGKSGQHRSFHEGSRPVAVVGAARD